MEDRKPNPKLLVICAIAGALFATSTFLLAFLPIPQFNSGGSGFWEILWMNRLRIVVLFAPFVLGIIVSFWAERRLKRGLQNKNWTEAELEPVRALVVKPIWLKIVIVLIAAIALQVIYSARTSHACGLTLLYLFLVPLQTVTRIRQLVIPPKANPTGIFTDSLSSKTIHSDHWGQPPVHPSE
jgi:hypothetical protein